MATSEEQQPMSDARLAEIRERLDRTPVIPFTLGKAEAGVAQVRMTDVRWAVYTLFELQSEVERLRACEAALVEVVRAVADARTFSVDEDTWALLLRNRTLSYAQTIWSKARAALASERSGGDGR